MQVINSLEQVQPLVKSTVVTLGNFDGVHLGHEALLRRLVQQAHEQKSSSLVVTFDPHPLQVLYPEREFQRIFPVEDQIEQMKKIGVDIFVRHPFNLEFSRLTPEEFLKQLIFKHLKPQKVIVGYDFAFGSGRQGTLKLLQDICQKNAIGVEIIPPFEKSGMIVSSSKIREFIRRGEIVQAQEFLGRPFYLQGKVIPGDRRGRTIGFPTANLDVPWSLKPRVGVYLTRFKVGGNIHPSMTNVGWNPTVAQSFDQVKIETHILNFDEQIYDQEVTLEFVKFLREEKKFGSLQELKQQLENDRKQAKEYFNVSG